MDEATQSGQVVVVAQRDRQLLRARSLACVGGCCRLNCSLASGCSATGSRRQLLAGVAGVRCGIRGKVRVRRVYREKRLQSTEECLRDLEDL